MGRPVTLDFSAGGGSGTEFLIGTITLEPTAVHEIGNRVVLPAPRTTGINAGVGVLEDVAISPAGPEPAWAYRATVRDSISGKAQTWLVGVPTGTTAIPFNQLTKFTTTIPPQTTAGMMQNWADTTEANADRSELAAGRAEAPTDLMNKNLIEDTASLTNAALSAAIGETTDPAKPLGVLLMQTYAQDDGSINAHDKRLGTAGTRASFINALDAAEAAGRGTVVRLGRGVTELGAGLSMNGRSSLIQGVGAFARFGSTQSGSVLKASAQAGPVLDLKGWIQPDQFRGRVRMGDFVIQGSGVADPTKVNTGLEFDFIGSTLLHDIAITDTGGAGIFGADRPGYGQYLSDFERITVTTPVGAYANDVPYIELSESNCNRWRGIGLRSVNLPPAGEVARDVGPSGAVRIISPNRPADPFSSVNSLYDAWWFENLHVPNGGTLVHVESRLNVFADFQFIDCWKEPDADDTSYFRFANNPAILQGGNEVRGHIPGRNPDYPDTNPTGYHSIDYGIDMQQPYNRVAGVKGRNGYNVRLRSAVNAYVDLGGSSFATDLPAVVTEGTASSTTVINDGSSSVRTLNGWKEVGTNGVVVPLTNLTASHTLTDTNNVVTFNGGAHTATLPDPTTVKRGREFVIKNLSPSVVTAVSAGSSKTIDGASSVPLAQWETLRVMSNGTMWIRV